MLSILDKSTTIPDWRDAPSVQQAVAEVRSSTQADVTDALQQAVSDASRALAEAEARVRFGLATERDVDAARLSLEGARQAITEHEDRVSRNAERVAASKKIAGEVIQVAQQATAQEVHAREVACAKRTVAAARKLMAEVESFHAACQVERDLFGDLLSSSRDPIGGPILPIGCYLPPGTQMPISFVAGQGYDAFQFMRAWLLRMEERGLA